MRQTERINFITKKIEMSASLLLQNFTNYQTCEKKLYCSTHGRNSITKASWDLHYPNISKICLLLVQREFKFQN